MAWLMNVHVQSAMHQNLPSPKFHKQMRGKSIPRARHISERAAGQWGPLRMPTISADVLKCKPFTSLTKTDCRRLSIDCLQVLLKHLGLEPSPYRTYCADRLYNHIQQMAPQPAEAVDHSPNGTAWDASIAEAFLEVNILAFPAPPPSPASGPEGKLGERDVRLLLEAAGWGVGVQRDGKVTLGTVCGYRRHPRGLPRAGCWGRERRRRDGLGRCEAGGRREGEGRGRRAPAGGTGLRGARCRRRALRGIPSACGKGESRWSVEEGLPLVSPRRRRLSWREPTRGPSGDQALGTIRC
eukprot:jgi/Botrbrau1/14486/Bobra.0014s0120.1